MKLRLAIMLFTTVLLASCALSVPSGVPEPAAPDANLYLYLQPLPQAAQGLNLTLSSIAVRGTDGETFPLPGQPMRTAADRLYDNQAFIGAVSLPPGNYAGLNVLVSAATLETEEGRTDLLVDDEPQVVARNFRIEREQALALFLELSPDRLVEAGYRLTARFTLRKALPPVTALKGVVSHPDANLLTLFEKNTPAVFSVLHLGARPAGLALDRQRRLVYVAMAGEDSVASVDLMQGIVERKARLRSFDRPEEIVLAADNRFLAVLNPGTSSLSILESGTLLERDRVVFNSRPVELFVGPGDSVYVLLPDTNGLALVDAGQGRVVATVDLPETPIDGVADSERERIFLLTEGSSELLVLDAGSLVVSQRIFIGPGAVCLALDRSSGLVYVGLEQGQVEIVDPQLGLPVDRFSVASSVVDLVVDREENSLFVLAGREGQVEKYDLVSRQRLGIVDLGAAAADVVIMGDE